MPKPLRLFIRPPFNNWSLEHGYGPLQPEPSTGPIFYNNILLSTIINPDLFAASDGMLSMLPPNSGALDPSDDITPITPQESLPETINLYLHLSPLVTARDESFRKRASLINNINGFAYMNVETASLENALAELLDHAVIPANSQTRSSVVEQFVSGRLNIPVTAGHILGKASTLGASAGSRQVGFSVLTDSGPLDPSHTYDWMRDFVEDGQSDLDAFLSLIPKRWPVIDANLSKAEAIALTLFALYPMPVLQEIRKSRNLSAAEWREVGLNQKVLWLNRLRNRVGHPLPGNTDPPFEFDDKDWKNVFQLEAIVEFYANYDDPWVEGATPRLPDNSLTGAEATVTSDRVILDGDQDLSVIRANVDSIRLRDDSARPSKTYRILEINMATRTLTVDGRPNLINNRSPWMIDLYVFVDFLNPSGASATAKGNVITLDGKSDLTLIRINHDTILLANDTARPNHLYRITHFDPIARTVTLDGTPILPGNSSTWEIIRRPFIVIIDSFGGRLRGSKAIVANKNDPNVLILDGLPNPSEINPNFDTIYLPSDTARTSRTYRITAVNNNNTVTVDGEPLLDGGSSAWHIQAGIGGELPTLKEELGPGGTSGFDHYDGVLFVLQNGTVYNKMRWSTYSSRNPNDAQKKPRLHEAFSSLRGNRRYDFSSFRSPGKKFLNYCFGVVDADTSIANDEVREARFYFDTPVTSDLNGKELIRLHRGNWKGNGNNSDGCLVSPSFYYLRMQLIELYQIKYADFNGPGTLDSEVNKAYGNHDESETLWENTEHPRSQDNPETGRLIQENWNDKIVGTLWLIRPDERA